MAVAPSLPPSLFRGGREGPADRAWRTFPPLPRTSAAVAGAGLALGFPASSPPPQALIVFLFQERLLMELGQENGERRSGSARLRVCPCLSQG